MRRLPGLSADHSTWRLPLSDGTARALPGCLLAVGEQRVEFLANLLRGDAALTLWSVCRAARQRGEEPRTIEQVAQWLARHALTHLTWSDEQWSQRTAAPAWVALAESAIHVASRVVERARAEQLSESLVEQGYLAGLLHDWRTWLANSGPPPVGNATTNRSPEPPAAHEAPAVPTWLATLWEPTDSTSDARLAELVRQTLNETREAPSQVRANELTAGGDDARRGAAVGPPAPDLAAALPELLERLRQAELREQQFDAALEQEKLAAVKELAYGASHEINNPLANISTRAQTLLRDEPDPERRRKLATINAQAFRAHEMISDLMLFAHPPALQLAEVDLVRLIDRVLGELSEQASSQQTELANRSPEGRLPIVADETLVAATVKSLCRNALEALGSGGVVEVLAERVEWPADDGIAQARLEVRDNGPGLAAEVRHHAFDPFYSGREAGRGLGLGLSKCWRVVTMHGGQVEVASEIGRGCCFTILLPIQPLAAATD